MKEHPILFSGTMVKAILEGRKMQTRRVITPQPVAMSFGGIAWRNMAYGTEANGQPWLREIVKRCPYGQSGDHLWVRETWQAQNLDRQWWHEVRREERSSMNWAWTNPVERAYLPTPPRWLPAIHMPRMACRITLEIVSVRVERVQDISGEDCVAEGIDALYEPDTNASADHYNRQTFAKLWDTINAKRGYGWDVNPWVWAIEFKQVTAS
jgi:hypothetical protein